MSEQFIDIQTLADIGRAVREARLEKGMNQSDYAALLGVGRRFLSELEGGKKTAIDGRKMLDVLLSIGFSIRLAR
ncbi:MAG: helix-turn-helix domain-containing protein [Rhodospirillales bacterium]|nr:helix-turn-helix domain-containing protein [Rhodospirillales bacterium]